jgi:bifunctional non-homologous end joining protein LigD
VYEEKIDGWRIVAYKTGRTVRLISRRGVDHTARFGELARAIGALPGATLVLDGEVAVFDERLVSRFDLSDPDPEVLATPPVYMAFDVLYARGKDFRTRPLAARREILERIVENAPPVFAVRRLAGDGQAAWNEVERRGLEQHHDLEEVRALLGHARIDTTQVYASIRPPQLKRAVSFYEERAARVLGV